MKFTELYFKTYLLYMKRTIMQRKIILKIEKPKPKIHTNVISIVIYLKIAFIFEYEMESSIWGK